MSRIAVVGGGISGLASAWALAAPEREHEVVLFEAAHYVGGHTHTVDVSLPDVDGNRVTHGVDTGFLVFNRRTYPGLDALFRELDVPVTDSDMSFSVQARADGLEWSGADLAAVFAQRRNLARPAFWHMLAQVMRFNRLATAEADRSDGTTPLESLGDFLDRHGFSIAFRDWYLLPMIACIWSCPPRHMLDFPLATLVRFCRNHGLLQVRDRPQWLTVQGGGREYVRRMLTRLHDVRLSTPVRGLRRDGANVWLRTAHGEERFDAVVLACHSDQALRLLGSDATVSEREVLGAIRYQPNDAVLHTDTALLPRHRQAWAAWNFESGNASGDGARPVCLHYWLNRLQPLPFGGAVMVSLNPLRQPDPARVIDRFQYDHPVFDLAAMAAQRKVPAMQGERNTWFCGAWTGYGFHEDGLQSAWRVVEHIDRLGAAPRLAA